MKFKYNDNPTDEQTTCLLIVIAIFVLVLFSLIVFFWGIKVILGIIIALSAIIFGIIVYNAIGYFIKIEK